MPLWKGKRGKTKKGIVHNIKQLIKDGYKRIQAIAIAMSIARKKRKKKKK